MQHFSNRFVLTTVNRAIANSIIYLTLIALAGCGPRVVGRRELRNQAIPIELRDKVWTLVKVSSDHVFDAEFIRDFNNSITTKDCSFTFHFADHGELVMTFKEYKFTGVYMVDGDRFNFIYDGFREKVVWTTNPECKITPTQMGYVFNSWDKVDYKIQGDSMILRHPRGDSLLLI